jgi:hypothetical protein
MPGKLGRAPKEIVVAWMRSLHEGDIALILRGESGFKHKPLQKLRAVHHNIAILLSQGKTDVDVSRITGRSIGNIAILKRDPAFITLLDHYGKMGQAALADVYQQLSDVGQAALAALQDKLEEDPDSVDDKVKVKIVEMAMDRTGHGPTRTVRTLNTKDAIKDLVERKRAEQRGQVIDVSAKVIG